MFTCNLLHSRFTGKFCPSTVHSVYPLLFLTQKASHSVAGLIPYVPKCPTANLLSDDAFNVLFAMLWLLWICYHFSSSHHLPSITLQLLHGLCWAVKQELKAHFDLGKVFVALFAIREYRAQTVLDILMFWFCECTLWPWYQFH